MTPKRGTPQAPPGLDGLTGALADVACWVIFYLQRATEDEVDPAIADALVDVVAEALRARPVNERVAFLNHAAARARTSAVAPYQDFLLEMAESLGLE